MWGVMNCLFVIVDLLLFGFVLSLLVFCCVLIFGGGVCCCVFFFCFFFLLFSFVLEETNRIK